MPSLRRLRAARCDRRCMHSRAVVGDVRNRLMIESAMFYPGNYLFPNEHSEQSEESDYRWGRRADAQEPIKAADTDPNSERYDIDFHCAAAPWVTSDKRSSDAAFSLPLSRLQIRLPPLVFARTGKLVQNSAPRVPAIFERPV